MHRKWGHAFKLKMDILENIRFFTGGINFSLSKTIYFKAKYVFTSFSSWDVLLPSLCLGFLCPRWLALGEIDECELRWIFRRTSSKVFLWLSQGLSIYHEFSCSKWVSYWIFQLQIIKKKRTPTTTNTLQDAVRFPKWRRCVFQARGADGTRKRQEC